MTCRMVGAKPLSEPMLGLSIGTLGTNFSEILIEILTFSVKISQEYVFESVVWEMAVILSRPRCVINERVMLILNN